MLQDENSRHRDHIKALTEIDRTLCWIFYALLALALNTCGTPKVRVVVEQPDAPATQQVEE